VSVTLPMKYTEDFVWLIKNSILYGQDLGYVNSIRLHTDKGDVDVLPGDMWWDADEQYLYLHIYGYWTTDNEYNIDKISLMVYVPDRGLISIAECECSVHVFAMHSVVIDITLRIGGSEEARAYMLNVFNQWSGSRYVSNLQIVRLRVFDYVHGFEKDVTDIVERKVECLYGDYLAPCSVYIRVRDSDVGDVSYDDIEVYNSVDAYLFTISPGKQKIGWEVFELVFDFNVEVGMY